MICDLISFKVKGGYMTGYRVFFLFLLLLLAGMIVGCNTDGDSGGGDDDDTPAGVWTLISNYYYSYNNDGLLSSEQDDNDADGFINSSADLSWYYDYDNANFPDRRSSYRMYEGLIPPGQNPPADAIGEYLYDSNGCNNELIETDQSNNNEIRWEYDTTGGADCNRTRYRLYNENDDQIESGTYTWTDGAVTRLELDSGDYWVYTIDEDGNREAYDFYSSGELFRYGNYIYNGDRLTRLENFERR